MDLKTVKKRVATKTTLKTKRKGELKRKGEIKQRRILRKLCCNHFDLLVDEYKVDVSLADVKKALALFIRKMQYEVVERKQRKIPIYYAIEDTKRGQQGFSDKIDLVLWLLLMQIKRNQQKVYFPSLGRLQVRTDDKENWVCFDVN